MTKQIAYPYIPEGRTIEYVPGNNMYICVARDFARLNSLDPVHPTGTVIVKHEQIVSFGANGSSYHETHGCERKKLGCKTGEGYELCEGCHPKNHSEASAIRNAKAFDRPTEGADLYLWGHWWCCKPCWNSILEAKINQVFLLEGSEILFNREQPGNIIGNQFK